MRLYQYSYRIIPEWENAVKMSEYNDIYRLSYSRKLARGRLYFTKAH
jgi:hypothetical protein